MKYEDYELCLALHFRACKPVFIGLGAHSVREPYREKFL